MTRRRTPSGMQSLPLPATLTYSTCHDGAMVAITTTVDEAVALLPPPLPKNGALGQPGGQVEIRQ